MSTCCAGKCCYCSNGSKEETLALPRHCNIHVFQARKYGVSAGFDIFGIAATALGRYLVLLGGMGYLEAIVKA